MEITSKKPLLTYGLSIHGLKHISEVPNGKKCGCVCPNIDCRKPLIARNRSSEFKEIHFAHAPGADCGSAYESALHLLAKEVFRELGEIRIPDYHYDYNNWNSASLFKHGELVKFDSIEIEKEIKECQRVIVKPDAVGLKGNRKLYIEFANSHFVDEIKREKLRMLNLPTIEVDMSTAICDRDYLKNFLLANSRDKYWIYCPKLDEEYSTSEMKKNIDIESERIENERLVQLKKDLAFKEQSEKIYNASAASRRQNKAKFYAYQSEGKGIYVAINGVVSNCNKIKNQIASLKPTKYYEHEVLKYIIDGIDWDGFIRGNDDVGQCILLEGDRYWCREGKKGYVSYLNEYKDFGELFFEGLLLIQDLQKQFGNCNNCKFLIEKLHYEEDFFDTEDDLMLLGRIDLSVCDY